jgi:hypothetical protein
MYKIYRTMEDFNYGEVFLSTSDEYVALHAAHNLRLQGLEAVVEQVVGSEHILDQFYCPVDKESLEGKANLLASYESMMVAFKAKVE